MEGAVLLLHPFYEILQLVFEKFLYVLLLNDLTGKGLIEIFVPEGLVCGGEGPAAQTLVHFDDEFADLFVFLFHSDYTLILKTIMSINKKIVTCQKCKYFATKADQLSSRAIKIT